MKKNTEIIDDGTEDLVAPIIPVVPVKPEDVSTPTVPQEETPAQIISPTEPEVIKNPLEELEKQKDNIPLPPTEEEAKIITEEKEVSGDYPMISGDKVINMLRIILLGSKQHVYVCRMGFESAVEFDSGHSITFLPDEDKMTIEKRGQVKEYKATEFYSMSDIQENILEPYLFSLQQTYAR